MKAAKDHENEHVKDSSRFKFIYSMKYDEIKEFFNYDEIIDYLKQQDNEIVV